VKDAKLIAEVNERTLSDIPSETTVADVTVTNLSMTPTTDGNLTVTLLGPNGETLETQIKSLCAEMTVKEKIYMLSGHTILQSQKDMCRTGRSYTVHALPAGGCKRLGIPSVLFTDGPRGVVMGNSTCFPVPMLRASSFDEELEYRIGKAIADEAIVQGANYFGGICINLVRNPRWGRAQESYGEDQFLLGQFGAALTRSVQEEGMIACPKHFALNSIEDLRFYVDVKTDDRTLHEVYLPHFKM
jgi:beta-glucosidase